MRYISMQSHRCKACGKLSVLSVYRETASDRRIETRVSASIRFNLKRRSWNRRGTSDPSVRADLNERDNQSRARAHARREIARVHARRPAIAEGDGALTG